ncbi:MAG: hypothetical protein LH477_06355 [Nocardioides sp.]|nr:hypothetical protein [Nocardioides sp.]
MSRKPRPVDVPAATRSTSPGWRDPRLWVGVVLVTGSVVAGARIMAGADDTTAVWAASGDLVAGQMLTSDDLTATRVRFADDADGGRYLAVDAQLPDDLTLVRAVEAGELLPASVLGAESGEETVTVSIAVAPEHVPTDLVTGSHVDVWVVGEDRRSRRAAELVLDDIVIIDAPVVSDSFATSGNRQLVLAVPVTDEDALAQVLAASGDNLVRVVGRS